MIYADFVKEELEDQRASKGSIEQRGLAVVSTSGVLVTLLFGFAAIAGKHGSIHISPAARIWFYIALGAFVLAAIGGILANTPRTFVRRKVKAPRAYRATLPEELEWLVKEKREDSPHIASRRVTATRVVMYRSYVAINNLKGNVLASAITFEVAAVVCLAVAIGLVIGKT